MSVLLLPPIFQFFDDNGDPLAGGFVYTYAAGTTTPLATYTDFTGTIAAPNPIQLDAAGRPESGSGAIWGEGAYKFIVKNSAGVQVGATLDNITSFTTLASTTNAYFESFSGNSSQTVFTTSTDLGTEEKGLMVFVSKGLQEIAVNGSFATDTDWTKGAGWTIAAGVATATGAISTALSQVPVISLVVGQAYAVTYTITRSAGGLIPSLGGQNGTERTASGTYREVIIAAATTPIAFTGNLFTGTLDAVSITRVDAQGYDIINPSAFTISGTSLTFATAPATGTGNIYVFAPSLLLGAASAAAALAQTYAANALASQTAAATSAALAAASIKVKPAVACATTANITLSGEQTIDTVLTSASRVLVKNQSDARLNGVYVSAAGAWARATDADTWTEIQGQSVFTTGGSANINKTWANTNEAGGTIGVDNITWTELFFAIPDNSVTNAKLADMAANTVKVRAAGTSGDPSDLALGANQFIGRAPTGDIVAGTFGTNLSWSGTTLNAAGGGFKTTTTASASANITFSSLDFANNTYEFYFHDIVNATDNTNFVIYLSPDNFSSSVDTVNFAYGMDSATAANIGGEVALLKFLESARTLTYEKLHGAAFVSQLISGAPLVGTFGVSARGQTNPSVMNGVIGNLTNPATYFNAVRFQMSAGNLTSGSITMIRKPIS